MDEKPPTKQPGRAPETGSLPNRRPDFMWAGPGGGATCSICGATAGPETVEFELAFASESGPGSENFHVHVSCFTAWRERRGTPSRLPDETTNDTMPTRGAGADKARPA